MPLIWTPEMSRQASGNKATGTVMMNVTDFLRLTTPNDTAMRHIIDTAKPLGFYNTLARAGEVIIPPFVKVNMETGEIEGHEGRHRAAALFREQGPAAKMKVAVILTDKHGYGWYKQESVDPKTGEFVSRYYEASDIPATWFGQFRPIKAKIDRRSFRSLHGRAHANRYGFPIFKFRARRK